MKPANVLVVDDERANRELYARLLAPLGYAVRSAGDGEEALAEVDREAPDLVLLDLQMPRCDGYAVCRRLKSDPATRLIPVVVVTSHVEMDWKLAAVEIGADDYLPKPFSTQELVARVKARLALKRHTDELEHAARVLEGVAHVVEERDGYTAGHCRRIGEHGARVGAMLGLGEAEQKLLRLGGIFHDLGKIAVPDAILQKPGALTTEEFEVIKRHPVVGAKLCAPLRSLRDVIPLIRHHHEKLDGTGYPDGLAGDAIPLAVRILTVVDVYDALATDRPYKKAFPREKCLAILRDGVTRGWYDGEVVDAFARGV